MNRREAISWMTVAAGSIAAPVALTGCQGLTTNPGHAAWPDMTLPPVRASGYGTDPDLIIPASPWPRLLTAAERATAQVLADIIVPRDGDVPSASEVGVVEFVDEWVSAPYPRQQTYRRSIVPGLRWLDAEATLRFDGMFTAVGETSQLAIVDDIANSASGESSPAHAFFVNFRTLTVGGFYTSPAGTQDLGYLGNVPIASDYPGPSDEALQHLQGLLDDLGLKL